MLREIKVHIFSLKPGICGLIKKSIGSSNYAVSCTNATDLTDNFFEEFDSNVDCIIIDKDIENNTKDKLKRKFNGIPIICLPSLDSENLVDNRVKYISEPLKLSELVKTLDEIFDIESN
ncbi:MAG: hypothetical protein ABSF32_01285 [Ignavibacteria bacterium]|jgi:hypothetical protein